MKPSPARALADEIDSQLSAPGAMTGERFRRFLEKQRELGLVHGSRPLCRHLRPYVLEASTYRRILRAAELVSAALERVAERARSSETLANLLGLSAAERQIEAVDPGYPALVTVGRLDMLVTAEGFRFIELNADSPAGLTDQLLVNEALLGLPHLEFLRDRADAWTPAPHRALLSALARVYHAFRGRAEKPRIAIVDWATADTCGEFRKLVTEFARDGYHARILNPGDLEYENGALCAEGEPIELVYRRVIVQELLDRCGMDHALLRAYRERRVCVANSFRTKAVNKKAAFAVLSDPRFADLFTSEQREALRAHIPWTRLVQSGATEWQGRGVPLLELLYAERERFVLKPNDDYGGRGVLLGWETAGDEWREAVSSAARGGFVVQERQHCLKTQVPTFSENGITREDVYFDVCPFVFAGRASGAMVRFSASAVSNVSAGGSVSGLLVVEDSESNGARHV